MNTLIGCELKLKFLVYIMSWPGIYEFTPEFFDKSSQAWMANKIRNGSGIAYKCVYIHSNSTQCSKAALSHDFCKRHIVAINQYKNKRV